MVLDRRHAHDLAIFKMYMHATASGTNAADAGDGFVLGFGLHGHIDLLTSCRMDVRHPLVYRWRRVVSGLLAPCDTPFASLSATQDANRTEVGS